MKSVYPRQELGARLYIAPESERRVDEGRIAVSPLYVLYDRVDDLEVRRFQLRRNPHEVAEQEQARLFIDT